jgi:hypothetical protein
VRACDDKDRAAVATVAPAWATARHPLFAPEGQAAAPSGTRLDVDVYLINEHRT